MRSSLVPAAVAVAVTAVTTVAVPAATADEAVVRKHQASVSFMGFAGFLRINAGSFAFAYERRLTDHAALRVAGDFIHVHHAAEHVQAHQWTFGGSLGLRYHLNPAGGMFVGAEVGYRRGFGHVGDAGTPEHTMLANRQLRVMPELGARVPHPRLPLVFVTRVAAGYGPYTVTATDRDDAIGDAAAQYAQDVLGATALAVDVELSLAYAF